MKKWSFCLTAISLVLSTPPLANCHDLREASGITRHEEYLLVVGDSGLGAAYHRHRLEDGLIEANRRTDHVVAITLGGDKGENVALAEGSLPFDLEAIDLLADGRVVALSERLRGLVGEEGLIVDYDHAASEFGNRGLEGLAVRKLENGSSRIAVLWEGGYAECEDVPESLRPHVLGSAMPPVIWVHDLKSDERGSKSWQESQDCRDIKRIKHRDLKYNIELKVPKPSGEEPEAQRFRAPDLVWHEFEEGAWGFIVLLSSQNSPMCCTEYEHKWLQRFDLKGEPIGVPLDIRKEVSEKLKIANADELENANWEGLGWFEPGVSLVLIHDVPPGGSPTAIIVNLPLEWMPGDNAGNAAR